MQVYGLISNISPIYTYLSPGHWICSVLCHLNSTESIQSRSHFGALNLSYTLLSLSYQVLIFTWVKWSILRLSALPKDTTSKQCPNIERGETWYFYRNPAPNGIWNRTADSDIGKAPRSNNCSMFSSTVILGLCYPLETLVQYIHHVGLSYFEKKHVIILQNISSISDTFYK